MCIYINLTSVIYAASILDRVGQLRNHPARCALFGDDMVRFNEFEVGWGWVKICGWWKIRLRFVGGEKQSRRYF